MREDPEEWVGCQHGEMDDLTCAYMTELGLPVFTPLSETACPAEPELD